MTRDPYCDPQTGVLLNLLGIDDAGELARMELTIAKVREAELLRTPEPGSYDLDHLQRIHRRLFSDVYAWAGETRTVGIARTAAFALPQFIEGQAEMIFNALAGEDHLLGLDGDQFVERLAHYFGEVNALHPFREGNGRTQRAFFRQLAAEAGWWIHWSQVSGLENQVASRQSLLGNLVPLRDMLGRIIRPL